AGLEKALDASLELHDYPDVADARRALEEQKVFAILRASGGGVELDVAAASGATVAELLGEAALKVGEATGVEVT
ncbi:ABC transporter permease, partial [Streptomyces sp. SID7499]|nr:ABC transporter permease [Streptomyces sp. SID7499]